MSMHPIETAVREAFCEIGRRIWHKGMVASNDGNFSFRLAENLVLATPTMMSKGFLRPEDMVLADLDGNQVGGTRRLTSEVRIHLFIYRHRPDVHSVVHAHPPCATAFAVARRPLPRCILAEAEINLGIVPTAPYATTGTWEFARTIEPWVRTHDAFLLANHGAIVVGSDPYDAYYRLETLEQYARILLEALRLGPWNELDHAAMADLLKLKERLGMRDPRLEGAAEMCGTATPPTPATEPPAAPFVPHPGPITDEPKFSPLRRPAAAAAPAAADGLVRAVTEEVLRRLRGA
jgi:L-fuculose-phosphate aldolase